MTKQLAQAIHPDLMASVSIFCDPNKYAWRASERRFDSWKTVLGRAMEKTDEEQAHDAVVAAEAAVASIVSTHAGYRHDLVVEILENSAYKRAYAQFVSAARRAQAKRPQPRRPTARFVPPIVQRSATWVDELITQITSSILSPGLKRIEICVHTAPEVQEKDPTWFVFDQGFPAEIANAMLGKIESEAALLALRHVDHWGEADIKKLADDRERSIRRYGSYIAALPGAKVDLIPPSERMNIDEVIARHALAQKNHFNQVPRLKGEIAK